MKKKKSASSLKKLFSCLRYFIDVVISLIALLILAPLMLLIALLIWMEDRGPVLFKQQRTGKDNTIFYIYKFRSMYVRDEESLNVEYEVYNWENGVPDDFIFKNTNDTNLNVTRIGSFIRKTSLDELPQLFNILIGDMNIVGPRPEIPVITKCYTEEQRQRLKVKPGLTGWAQIHGRSEMSNGEKMAYDMYYVNNHSLLLDIYIILKTIKVVITTKGAV
ncbi:glycosyl transferase [Bacillus cereus]|uniref:sugar transferase n=1 Tax=Bacillus cereus TaxID=1396 RepID=UPI000BF4DB80|nr:sugar transferase [Bacillus cereus]PEX06321.1 glycosyl transferase [Bacillus cereus]PGV18303.1 glycosyl transferase [Bacillus cereus]